jgi:hypothetical protein
MSPGVSVAPNEAAERRTAAVAGSARIGAGDRHRRRGRHVGEQRISCLGAAKRPRQHALRSGAARPLRRRDDGTVDDCEARGCRATDRDRHRAGDNDGDAAQSRAHVELMLITVGSSVT